MTALPLAAVRSVVLGRFAPYLMLLFAMVSLTMGTSFAKTLFPAVGAAGASALRVGLAAAILLAFWRPWRFRLSRADLGRILLYGACMGGLNLTFYLSLKTIPLGVALAIEFAGPLTLALIHSRRLIHFVWVGCAVVGLGLLLPLPGAGQSLDPVGVGLAGAAAVFWALYIIFGKRVGHLHPGQSVSLGMLTSALVVVPFGVAEAGAGLLAPAILGAGLLVAVASSAVPYSLEMMALRRIPKRTFGVVLSAEPAIGAVAALVMLGEHLSGQQWVAILAIVAASVGAVATTQEEPPEDVPPVAN